MKDDEGLIILGAVMIAVFLIVIIYPLIKWIVMDQTGWVW